MTASVVGALQRQAIELSALPLTTSSERTRVVRSAIGDIRALLRKGIDPQSLGASARILEALAAETRLFSWSDFPLPEEAAPARTFLLSQTLTGRFAPYASTGSPGITVSPHDHGDTWSITAAVTGTRLHRVYRRAHFNRKGISRGLDFVFEKEVRPGQSIVLHPGDVHSVHSAARSPMLHLHLYGLSYQRQQPTRLEFDPRTGEGRPFDLGEIGPIEDCH